QTSADWRALLDQNLGRSVGSKDSRARHEKTAALRELAESRFSVLVGPAGSGKTKLLSALCSDLAIRDGGILLLAPTGKARVRLQTQVGLPAQTLSQFLLRPFGRYEPTTGTYRLVPIGESETRFK